MGFVATKIAGRTKTVALVASVLLAALVGPGCCHTVVVTCPCQRAPSSAATEPAPTLDGLAFLDPVPEVLVAAACPSPAASETPVPEPTPAPPPSLPVVPRPECPRIGVLGAPFQGGGQQLQDWLGHRAADVSFLLADPTASFDPEQLGRFDVILAGNLQRALTELEAEVLKRWVAAGGGLFCVTGFDETPSREYANTLLAPFGLSFVLPLLATPAVRFAKHPMVAGVSHVPFDGGFAIIAQPSSGAKVIARADEGPVGVAAEVGRGRVFAFGDEWIFLGDFEAEGQSLERLWSGVMRWLSRHNKCYAKPYLPSVARMEP